MSATQQPPAPPAPRRLPAADVDALLVGARRRRRGAIAATSGLAAAAAVSTGTVRSDRPREDPLALIAEARKRQRRRRVGAAGVAALASAATVILYDAVNYEWLSSPSGSRPVTASSGRTLTLQLRGFGSPLPAEIDRGPCPQGRTLVPVVGSRRGSATGCVLTIRKVDQRGYGVRRITQTTRETYALDGGTIRTRETQTIEFARDQRHTDGGLPWTNRRQRPLRPRTRHALRRRHRHRRPLALARFPPLVAQPEWDAAEALIEEARRRARRRRFSVAAALLVAAVVAAIGIVIRSHLTSPVQSTRSDGRTGTAPRASVEPKWPGALAVMRDGTLLVSDQARNQILAFDHGRFRVFAGSGRRGFAGDGRAARNAELDGPGGIAVAADGSVYFADIGNNRVRRVSSRRVITTVAGSGRGGWVTSGTPALEASLLSPEAIAFDRTGRLYVAVAGSSEIVRLEADGTLTRIAGVPERAGVSGIGGPAVYASADGPSALAFDRHGNLFIAGLNTKTLLMIGRDQRMRIPGGSRQRASGFYPRGAAGLVSADGRVFGMNTQQLVRITANGVDEIYDFGRLEVSGITGFLPGGIAVGAGGRIYTDTAHGNGWSNATAIIAIGANGHISTLWQTKPRR